MPTLQCLSRDALKEYLSGWTDSEQSDAIESHLTQCSDCEQTIYLLESDPETLIEFVRNSRAQASAEMAMQDSAIAYALSRAKKLSTTSDAPPAPWQPPVGDFGPYELLRPLGQGGMASVYLARHRQLGKQVAIKLLPSRPFRNDHYAARFQREIRTAGQLNHPAIVSATDAGEHAGTHYLVMEYIDGLDLSRVARLNGPLPIAEACAIMRTVAIGLSHAHAEGIVHRDIKPSNLMLSVAGDVKILDFGLAQVSLWDEVSAELTTVGQLMGTLDYMAPEQAERPDAVDYRADLYSIGATLFRLLCGRAPLSAAPDLSPLVKLRLLASHQPPRLDTLRPDAPEKLVDFVAQLLARNPADRPASAAHVAEQLARFTEAADLKLLISAAQSKSQQVPSPKSPIATTAVEPHPASSGSGRRISRWLLAASLLPLFILAGVLITLETQKGQLVIESENANVEVKLLRDGEFYEKLKIIPGVNSTRLYAGKYEVILDTGSDAFSFDQPTIEITRGNTVIAHVRCLAAVPNSLPSVQSVTADLPHRKQLLYGGKTLDAWVEILETDRSPNELAKALEAMNALATDAEAAKQIEALLLKVLPKLGGLSISIGGYTVPVDNVAFGVLYTCKPNMLSFLDLLVNEIKSGDDKWSQRCIVRAFEFASGAQDLDELEPLREWIVTKIFQSDENQNWLGSATELFLNIQSRPNLDESQRRSLIDDLLACQKLGLEFWLKDPPPYNVSDRHIWTQSYAAAVESKALETLRSPVADVQLLAKALIVLEIVHSPSYRLQNLNPTTSDSEVWEAATAQLDRVCTDSERFLQMIPLDSRFLQAGSFDQTNRQPVGNLKSLGINLSINWTGSSSVTCLGIEFLQLTKILQGEKNKLQLLEKILQTTRDEAFEFANTITPPYESANESKKIRMNASWPELQLQGSGTRPTKTQFVSYVIFDRAFSMLPEPDQTRLHAEYMKGMRLTWLRSLTKNLDKDGDGKLSYIESQDEFTQPTQLPYAIVTENVDIDHDQFISVQELFEYLEKPQPKANNLADSPPKKTSEQEPLYEGKTLSDWLEQFARERSPTGSGAALKAISALVSKSDAQRIEKVLIENLRTLGSRTIIDDGGGRKVIDSEAFPILARCFTVRKEYFEMVATELESADDAWAERIFKSAVERFFWQPEDVEPLVKWVETNVLKLKRSPELTWSAAKLFLEMIDGSPSTSEFATLKNRLVDGLANSEQIGLDFWMSLRPHLETSGAFVPHFRPYYPGLASAIELKAIGVIISNDSSLTEVNEAAVMLSALNSDRYDRKDMAARPIATEFMFIQALGKRLVTQSADAEHRLACETLRTRFNGLSEQGIEGALPFIRTTPQFRSNMTIYETLGPMPIGAGKRNVALQLIECIANLKLESELRSQLRAVVDATSVEAQAFAREVNAKMPFNGLGDTRIALDRLEASPLEYSKFTGKDFLHYIIFARAYLLLPEAERSELLTDKAIRELDGNGDGSLSYEEVKSAMPDPAEFDANKDQLISREELLKFVIAGKKQNTPTPGKQNSPDPDANIEWAKKQVDKYDKNKDGTLTVDEWSAMVVKIDGADANNDGVITVEEFAEYRRPKK